MQNMLTLAVLTILRFPELTPSPNFLLFSLVPPDVLNASETLPFAVELAVVPTLMLANPASLDVRSRVCVVSVLSDMMWAFLFSAYVLALLA